MWLPAAILFLSQTELCRPVHRETTVAELFGTLEQSLHARVDVDPTVGNRIVYACLLPQPPEEALRGLVFSLNLISTRDTKTGTWHIRPQPPESYPAAGLYREAIQTAIDRFTSKHARDSGEPLRDILARDLAKPQVSRLLPSGERKYVDLTRTDRESAATSIVLRFLSQMPDPASVAVQHLKPASVVSVPLSFDHDLPVILLAKREASYRSAAAESARTGKQAYVSVAGDPIVVAAPSQSDNLCGLEFWTVDGKRAERFGGPTATWKKRPTPVNTLDPSVLSTSVNPPGRLYHADYASTDAVPSIAEALGYSMATWAEPGAPIWRFPRGQVSLGWLAANPQDVGGNRYPGAGFESAGKWIRLNYAHFKPPTGDVPWPKLLPWLRKARTGALSLAQVSDFMLKLSDEDVEASREVDQERPILTRDDRGFVGGAGLLRCFFNLTPEQQRVIANGEAHYDWKDMSAPARAEALATVRYPNGVDLATLSPTLAEDRTSLVLIARIVTSDGLSYLNVMLNWATRRGNSFGGFHMTGQYNIPISGI